MPSYSSSSSLSPALGSDASHHLDFSSKKEMVSKQSSETTRNGSPGIDLDSESEDIVAYLFSQFCDNYSRTKEEGLLSVIRTKKQSYGNMAEVMDCVLSRPLTDFRGVSTASAKALMMTLGCKKHDFLGASKAYNIYKSINDDLSGEDCFKQFAAKYGNEYPSVLGRFMPQQPASEYEPKT